MAAELIAAYEPHWPIRDRKVKIDFVFAFADRDETTGEPTNNALTKGGVRALGITRKISLKDRAKGMGDCEITLDADHWTEVADEGQQRAILDHELYHIVVSADNDDLGRPKIKLRKHDFEFGWFANIAIRHGVASCERIQAKRILDAAGQAFWPELLGTTQPELAARAVRATR